jgi:carbon-monoxide dehydrogenase medium subunit
MLSKFDYVKPTSLEEALRYIKDKDGVKLLAGGTDLMISLRHNVVDVKHIIDIKDIPETKIMKHTPGEGVFIGASITVNQIAQSKIIKEKYPALVEGSDFLASYQLRNRATLVGNICNASPGADLAPSLLLYDSIVSVASPNGNREININEFFTGVKKTILQKDEIVLGVLLPEVQKKDKSTYLKQSRLKGHDLATVGVAIRVDSDNNIYIAMAAVAPTPIRLLKLEEAIKTKGLNSETAQWIEKEVPNYIKPISDVRSSAQYRLHAASVLAKQGLTKLIEERVV